MEGKRDTEKESEREEERDRRGTGIIEYENR